MSKMKTFFFSLIFSGIFASAYQLELKPKSYLKLDQKVWAFGQGQLTPNTTHINLYSHKKNKDTQITYEDLFFAQDVINQRLPDNCKNKFDFKQAEKSSTCKFSKDEKEIGKYSFTVISIFKTTTPEVFRVRSVFFIGQKKNLSELERNVDDVLNPASSKMRKK